MITLDGTAPYDFVRDEVVDLGVGLLRLEQRRHRLEDLFRADEKRASRWLSRLDGAQDSIYDLGYRPYDGARLGRRLRGHSRCTCYT